MSEYKHLDDIDDRAHHDRVLSWFVVATLLSWVVLVVLEISPHG